MPMGDQDSMFQDPALMEALLSFEQEGSNARTQAELAGRKVELHAYLRGWLAKAMMARRANQEDKWTRWRRNARNIYDPAKKARKERWQSALFVPLSMQTKEVIKSQLFRTLFAGLPYSLRPYPSGSTDEAFAMKTLLLREMRMGKLEAAANDMLDDLLVYGNGFLKIFHNKKTAKRSRRVPIYPPVGMRELAQLQQGIPLEPVAFQRTPPEEVVVSEGVEYWHVSIWDLFFNDMAKSLNHTPIAQRYRMMYQEVLDGVKAGYFFPEAAVALRDVKDTPWADPDRQRELGDNFKSQIEVPTSRNEKGHTCYEFWGLLPQRLVYVRPEEQHLITDPEELMAAKAVFTAEALLAVDENDDFQQSHPYRKAGYLKVPGSIYDVGVCEMIEQMQDDTNETTNQRKDNVNLILNRMGVILESALVSRADLISRPGGFIRVKRGASDDVNKAVSFMEMPDVTQSSYLETANNERFAQELTGATRVLIGTAGTQARDVTQTKGGMQIVHQSSSDRLTYYAMLIEADLVTEVVRRTYALIYANANPQKLMRILGPLANTLRMLPPEDVENDYRFEPEGVFATMHQPVRIAQWQAFRDQFAGSMFFDDLEMAQLLARAIELPNPEKVVVPMRDPITGEPIPFQMMQQMALAAQAFAGAPLPPAGPGKAGAAGTNPQMPTKKATKNAPQERAPK